MVHETETDAMVCLKKWTVTLQTRTETCSARENTDKDPNIFIKLVSHLNIKKQ